MSGVALERACFVLVHIRKFCKMYQNIVPFRFICTIANTCLTLAFENIFLRTSKFC